LLAAAVQAGLGAWGVSGEAGGASLAAYLGGCAVTGGIIGLVLCLAPLPAGRPPTRLTACGLFVKPGPRPAPRIGPGRGRRPPRRRPGNARCGPAGRAAPARAVQAAASAGRATRRSGRGRG